ncbi:hypothetical protein E2C01_054345 [Portunus trituberculatus]|uniref:Uncharacterized protein n=1 Tax=Portunus trituberculatus TaxID=210409 RepID=A0A5B7GUR7_PORTR|nr:hypothetical protein [Portunus trituberculatus]
MNTVTGIQGVLAVKKVPVVDERPSIAPTLICKPAVHCNSPEQLFTSQFPPRQLTAYHRGRTLIPNLSQCLLKPPNQLLTPYLTKVISLRADENNGFGLILFQARS